MKLLLLQDVSSILSAGAAPETTDSIAPDEFTKSIKTIDSVSTTVSDSLRNMSLSDIGQVITGKNTLLKDAMGSFLDLCVAFVPKLIACILVLWIGFRLVKLLKKAMGKMFDRHNMESSLRGFLVSFVDVVLKILIITMAMDIIGIKATSFIAILGAAGLAVGMALQGTLQNFAGGVIILIMKPFRVGDHISGGGHEGIVKEIRIFNTILLTFDNKTIIIPNTDLATASLINYSQHEKRRIDIKCGIAYGQSVDKAREVLINLANSYDKVLQDKAPAVLVDKLNDSSVDLILRVWCKTADYWDTLAYLTEQVYNEFNKHGIDIPFPQLTVHMDKE